MPRIMYCTMEETELQGAVRLAEQMECELLPYLAEGDDEESCLKIIRVAEEKQVDAILARGRILAHLKAQNCPIPIALNYVAGKETFTILYRMKQEAGLTMERPKVCLLSHRKININEEMLNETFNMDVHNVVIPLSAIDNMSEFLQELRKENYDCVACGRSVAGEVTAAGMRAFSEFQITTYDAIYDGLRMGETVALASAALKQKNYQLQTMVDNAFEEVLMLDTKGHIIMANQRACRELHLKPQTMNQIPVWEQVPVIRKNMILSCLNEGKDVFGEILKINSLVYVMNISAVREHSRIVGAAIQMTELTRIEEMEAAAKKGMYSKGYVAKYRFEDLVGKSSAMCEAKRFAAQFAKYSSNVLIIGETGNGKELFAQSIHNASLRSEKPFVAINCGAIPPNLLESELFGYVDGAFTGASRKGKKGLLEIADGGTVFLDEISEMDLGSQVQLLRVLEERVIQKIGDDKIRPVDIRIIAATNRNLRKYVEEGKFRQDLYYRLNVLTLHVPPLREREDDVLLLADEFFRNIGRTYKKMVDLTPEAQEVLRRYSWPGNVRQLRNFCERLVVVSECGLLEEDFVRRQLMESFMLDDAELQAANRVFADDPKQLKEEEPINAEVHPGGLTLHPDEKERILEALKRSDGNRKAAAELLGISKATLWRKMKKYGIEEKF